MTSAPSLPFFRRGRKRPPALEEALPVLIASSYESVRPIEIVAPNRSSTDLLLEYAAPVFPAEIVSGSAWVVRLQPPTGGAWVVELLALVQRWLESAALPCANVLYGGRSYLIRSAASAPTATMH